MNILVTGGQGFLGKTLVSMLRARGDEVVSYDRRMVEDVSDSKLHHVQGDLNDLPLLIETIRRHQVDTIIHTAAISHPVASRDIPYQTVITNALGTTTVFEAARLQNIRRVVNFSSECAYGSNEQLGVIDEDAPLNPSTPYGATKVFGEKLAAVYNQLYGMEIISLRPGWIYGPGQFMQCYMKTLISNAIKGIKTVETEGLDYRFQYVHVTDVAHASILAATVPMPYTYVFNITGGDQITYAELVSHIKTVFPTADIEIGPGSIEVLDRNARFDLGRAKTHLGYVPQVTLDQGIRSYSDWLHQHDF